MAWPTLAELKASLGETRTDATRDAILARALGASVDQVKIDVAGSPAAFDDATADPPYAVTPSLEAAALLLAVTVAKAPDAPFGVAAVFDAGGIYVAARNPNYQRLLVGQRRQFGIA